MKEKWTAGKPGGCVVSDTLNRHGIADDHVEYYGGFLIAESIPAQKYVNLIAAAPSMLALLEKALPIIEREAEQRQNWGERHNREGHSYATEMRELQDEIEALIAKAKGGES